MFGINKLQKQVKYLLSLVQDDRHPYQEKVNGTKTSFYWLNEKISDQIRDIVSELGGKIRRLERRVAILEHGNKPNSLKEGERIEVRTCEGWKIVKHWYYDIQHDKLGIIYCLQDSLNTRPIEFELCKFRRVKKKKIKRNG